MLLNVLLAGFILFFINSCRIPIHFVGYQYRNIKSDKPFTLAQVMPELTEVNYKQYASNNCSYYFHKRNAHYFAFCQKDKDIYFIGTDVRSSDISRDSKEDVLKKIDHDIAERVERIKTTLSGLNSAISGPSFVVYKSHELESN